ncbi:tape measure protein [Pseudoclostridium thermosuccinogenes]|uniref:tape measure protein n=1 Tax=Clostridium thermosuccinogenes TaxID=84032 RepID=UPI002FD8C0C1
MAKNPNISISFSSSKAAQEVNKLASDLKALRKEFEVSNTSIAATGDKLALAQNKLKQFSEEAKILRSATAAMQRGLEDAANTQAKLAARVETAKQAYENAARSENASKEQVEKLKKEYEDLAQRLAKADKAVANWRNKLQDAKIAENKLKIAVNEVNKEIEEQNKKHVETVKNTRNVTSATGQLINIYTLLKGLILGYAGKTLFEALVGSNAQFEQYMATFEVLLGSAEKAQKRMAELTEFAAKTPFELPQLTEAEKRLLSYGVAAEDTAKMLQVLGDLSMGNAEKLGSLTLAYGQVVTATRLTGGELRQFAEAGIPLLDELAKMYNVTAAEMRDMISEGQISAEAVTMALQRMTSEGGKFFGMMEKQSQTMEGLWATLKDNVNMFARDVGEKSFRYLKNVLSDFMEQLEDLEQSGKLGDIAAEWGKNIAKFIEFIVDAIKTLWDMKEALAAAGIAIAAFKTSMAISNIILAVVNAIQSYTAAVNAGTTATAALTTVMNANPWALLASAIAAVVAGIVGYNLITRDATKETDELAESIKDLTEEYERNIRSIDKQTNSQLGEVSVAEKLVAELDELSKKTDKTASDKVRMAQIVDQLNQKIPNLALSINSETGELNKQIGVIYDTIEAYEQLLFVKASEKKASAAAETLIDLEKQRDLIEEQLKLFGDFEKQYSDYKMAQFFLSQGMELPENLKSARFPQITEQELSRYNNLVSQLNTVNQKIKEADQQIQDAFKKSAEYAEKYGTKYDFKEVSPYTAPPPLLPSTKTSSISSQERARQQAIQKEFQDLKFALDMGYITEAEYYKKLGELRDRYFEVGSSEWQQYTLQIKQYNDRLKEDAIKTVEEEYRERRQKSDQWIAEQKYYNKLSADEEIAAYERIRAYVKEYYAQGIIDQEEYYSQIKEINRKIYDVEREAYNERRKNSDKWIEEQKYYSKLTADEEIAAYERIRTYVKEYYEQGIIDQKEYYAQMKELDRDIYAVRKKVLEDSIKETVDASKKMLDARKKAIEEESKAEKKAYDERRKAIEDYYDSIERAENQQERSARLSELYQMERIYQNAVTLEGKNKLKEIREEINKLNREAEKEQRELARKAELEALESEYEEAEEERKRRLEAINEEYEKLDSRQKTLLENIANYASISAGTLEQVTNKIKSMLSALSSSNIGTINTKSPGPIYNLYQTNNNNITDPVSANIFGSYLSSGFMRFLPGVR